MSNRAEGMASLTTTASKAVGADGLEVSGTEPLSGAPQPPRSIRAASRRDGSARAAARSPAQSAHLPRAMMSSMAARLKRWRWRCCMGGCQRRWLWLGPPVSSALGAPVKADEGVGLEALQRSAAPPGLFLRWPHVLLMFTSAHGVRTNENIACLPADRARAADPKPSANDKHLR